MSIIIDPQLAQEIEERAKARGYSQPRDYLADLVNKEKLSASVGPEDKQADWAWDAINRAAGTATTGLSTDEIMEMTRGES